MPDSLINYTANGWPYLDANNYVEVIPQYTDELANQLDLQVVNPAQRLTTAENDIDALDQRLTTAENDIDALETHAALDIVGAGRPDIPATMTPAVAAAVAAAPSGARFRSTNGPQGAWEWQKQGTTWAVTVGDTGSRILPLINGWTGRVALRRINGLVTLSASPLTDTSNRLSGVAATADQFTALPGSFRPGSTWANLGFFSGIVTTGATVAVYMNGTFQPSISQRIGDITGHIQFPTHSAWPTTLPGTAA